MPEAALHRRAIVSAQSELKIKPSPASVTERIDYFGNHLCFFTVEEPHDELIVEARSEVVMEDNAGDTAAAISSMGRRCLLC